MQQQKEVVTISTENISRLYIKEATELCNQYEFKVVNDITTCRASGIGDILYLFLAIKDKLVKVPIYFSLELFTYSNQWYNNPLNALEFRLKMLCDILDTNGLPRDAVQFSTATNCALITPTSYFFLLSIMHLPTPKCIFTAPADSYIIFHTKLRHTATFDYATLKAAIFKFTTHFKTNHTIVILGEKDILKTGEAAIHNMQSCYNELLELGKLNTVVDLTIDNCDILSYEQYKVDANIISNAVTNVSFSGGGSFCTAMIYGKSTYGLLFGFKYNPEVLAANDAHIYKDYNKMIKDIEQRFSS